MITEIKADAIEITLPQETRESKRPTDPRAQRSENSLFTNIAAKIEKKYPKEQFPTHSFPTTAITETTFGKFLTIEDIALLTLTSNSSKHAALKYLNNENKVIDPLTTLAALNARLNELEDIRNDFEIAIEQKIKYSEQEQIPYHRRFMAYTLVCCVFIFALTLGLGIGYRRYSSDQAESKSDSISQFLSSCTGNPPTTVPAVWRILTDCGNSHITTQINCNAFTLLFDCNFYTCMASIKNFCAIGDPTSYRMDGFFWAAGAFGFLSLLVFFTYICSFCVPSRDLVLNSSFTKFKDSNAIIEKLSHNPKNKNSVEKVLTLIQDKILNLKKNIATLNEHPKIEELSIFLAKKNPKPKEAYAVDINETANGNENSLTTPLLSA